ncbi:MAG: SUMF1/EgtB/PvdO family nonheme iron enzyme [Armatimonadota bacterium]
MRKLCAVTAAIALLGLSIACNADVFGLTNMETVTVGDPGNNSELSGAGAGGYGPDRICGSVSYTYNIGKYEVTAAQYCDFLNHKAKSDPYGLYNTDMWSSDRGCKIQRTSDSDSYSYSVTSYWANRPVNYVSYWDACRFANWLHNGQGDGDTETGAYTLNGYNGSDGRDILRNTDWKWAVTNEDEWYKAAYYKGGGTNAGYWDYPMQSDIPTIPSNDISDPDGGNNANFYQNDFTLDSPYWRTEIGEFENSESAYGTFDQGGNVCEWNESICAFIEGCVYRGSRGSSFSSYDYALWASEREHINQISEYSHLGFRVSNVYTSPQVPEPASVILGAGGLISLFGLRRRKA